MNDSLYRRGAEHLADDGPRAHAVPGKLPATARLAAGPRMIFRVETAEAAQVFADAFGAESAVERAASSTGAPLPSDLQSRFESSLGADLSSVRVHTGPESADAAGAVGARAYTTGQDIHFAAGSYDPSSAFGVHLIAHEVAHTVQQQGGTPTRQHKLEVSSPGDHLEVEADRAADAMVAGLPASMSSVGSSGQVLHRDLDEDANLTKLPADPRFAAAEGSFTAMGKAVDAAMLGGAAVVSTPEAGYAGANNNLREALTHAEASFTYYNNHKTFFDAAQLNTSKAATANADAQWCLTMLADISVSKAATSSWVGLVNSSNTAWSDLVKQAEKLGVEVKNKTEPSLAALAGGPATKLGDQQINVDEVGGVGDGMAHAAKAAGTIKSPDATAYKDAVKDYNSARDDLVPSERRVVAAANEARRVALEKKKAAKVEEKDKWETIAKATDTFAKGLTIAVGGAAFVQGATGATLADPGSVDLTVKTVGNKVIASAQNNTNDDIVSPLKLPDGSAVVEKGHSAITFAIDWKIKQIAEQIAGYDTLLGNYRGVAEAQAAKANIEEYQNMLKDLRKLARRVEEQKEQMEKKIIEWGQQIDATLAQQGKAPKGSSENADAAVLLAKIRAAGVATDGAIEAMAGSASLPKLYSGLADAARTRAEAEVGRTDKRYPVFAIEQGRWTVAASTVGGVQTALTRRQAQITALESSFLSKFSELGASNPAGPLLGKTY